MGSWVQKSAAHAVKRRARSCRRSVPAGLTGSTFPIADKCAKLIDIRQQVLGRLGPDDQGRRGARTKIRQSYEARSFLVL